MNDIVKAIKVALLFYSIVQGVKLSKGDLLGCMILMALLIGTLHLLYFIYGL